MLPLIDDHSMFKTSINRIRDVFAPEDTFVVTGRDYADELQAEVPHIPSENFILEPYAKNTAPALALGLAHIQSRDPEATVAILTADHHIAEQDLFCQVLEVAYDVAQDGSIVTLGIAPSHPATGYGYIQQDLSCKSETAFPYMNPRASRKAGYRTRDSIRGVWTVHLEFWYVHMEGSPRHARPRTVSACHVCHVLLSAIGCRFPGVSTKA